MTSRQTPDSADRRATVGAVVLCGGRSQRMGFDKSKLPIGRSNFLQCAVDAVRPFASQTVVVGNPSQTPIDLGGDVRFLFDQHVGKGPMEGIRVGLQHLQARVESAFVATCDSPLVNGRIIPFLANQLGDFEAVIPVGASRVYGMTAIYRTSVHVKIAKLIDANQLKVSLLLERLDALPVNVDRLRTIDPQLDSFVNINRPEDYQALAARLEKSDGRQFS